MASENLNHAIQLIKSGNKQGALPILKEIVRSTPNDENAWLWLYSCLENTEQKKYCLQQVLRINPDNLNAHKTMLKLENSIASVNNSAHEPFTQDRATTQAVKSKKKQVWWMWASGIAGFMCVGILLAGILFLNSGWFKRVSLFAFETNMATSTPEPTRTFTPTITPTYRPAPTKTPYPTATPKPKLIFDSSAKIIPDALKFIDYGMPYGTFILSNVVIQRGQKQASGKVFATLFFEVTNTGGIGKYDSIEFIAVNANGVMVNSELFSGYDCELNTIKVQDGGNFETCVTFEVPTKGKFDVFYAPFTNDRFNENRSIKWEIIIK